MTTLTIEIVLALYWLGFVGWNVWLWKCSPEALNEDAPASVADIDEILGDTHEKHHH